jgi:hypothetical protein
MERKRDRKTDMGKNNRDMKRYTLREKAERRRHGKKEASKERGMERKRHRKTYMERKTG